MHQLDIVGVALQNDSMCQVAINAAQCKNYFEIQWKNYSLYGSMFHGLASNVHERIQHEMETRWLYFHLKCLGRFCKISLSISCYNYVSLSGHCPRHSLEEFPLWNLIFWVILTLFCLFHQKSTHSCYSFPGCTN